MDFKYRDFLVFLLFLGNTLINLISVTGGTYFFFLSLAITILYFLNEKKITTFDATVNIYLFIAVYAISGLLFAANSDLILEDITRVLSSLFCMMVVNSYLTSKKDLIKLLMTVVITVAILAFPNALFSSVGVREMFWGGVNPVGTMMFFSVVSIFLLVKIKIKWVLIFLPLDIYVIIISQSQKVILSIVLGVVVFILISVIKKGVWRNFKSILPILLFLVLGYFVISNPYFSESLNRTTATLQQLSSDEQVEGSALGGGYRTFLLEKSWTYFQEQPFIGYGLNNSRELYLRDIGRSTYSHNTWMELLLSFGVFFTLLYLIIVYRIFRLTIVSIIRSSNTVYIVLFCIILMIFLIGQFQKMYYDVFTQVFFIIAAVACTNPNIIERKEKSI